MSPRDGDAKGGGTKGRILAAAVETLKREGIAGTSARAIAQTGGFTPALLFYHFGTVSDLLVAAVTAQASERVERYAQRLAGVDRLPELVEVAAELHREDVREGHVAVLVQILAATASDPELARRLLHVFEPWIAVVREVLERVAGTSPLGRMVPTEDAAFAVTALFLGIELLTHLGDDFGRGEQLFASFSSVAGLLDGLMGLAGGTAGGPATE